MPYRALSGSAVMHIPIAVLPIAPCVVFHRTVMSHRVRTLRRSHLQCSPLDNVSSSAYLDRAMPALLGPTAALSELIAIPFPGTNWDELVWQQFTIVCSCGMHTCKPLSYTYLENLTDSSSAAIACMQVPQHACSTERTINPKSHLPESLSSSRASMAANQ